MLGYLDDPALTAASYEDGYFKTGDLARVDEYGRVALIGRAKEIVSRGGIKIAPLEVDHLLAESIPMSRRPCAPACPMSGSARFSMPSSCRAQALRSIPQSLRNWLLARTERNKVPEVFYVRDALPSGSTGKADRRAVARLAEGKL